MSHTLAGVERPDLSYNYLEDIPPELFIDSLGEQTPREMAEISFRNNLISRVSERAFRGVGTITALILQNNKLASVPEDLLANTTILERLSLASNQLTTMPNGLLRSQSKMKYLYLQRNQLTVLNDKIFKGLQSLMQLMIFDNPLIEVADRLFFDTHLTHLYMFQTNLSTLGMRPFATVNNTIEQLSLYGNYFESIPDDAWQDLAANSYISVDNVLKFAPSTNRTDLKIELVGDGFAQPINLSKTDGKILDHFGFHCHPIYPSQIWQCSPCPQGFYGTLWDNCVACPPGGFFQDESGQVANDGQSMNCRKCNNGTFVTPIAHPGKQPADCTVCPTGTNKSLHAGFRACPCVDNYFRRDRFGECYQCPAEGLNCSGEYQHLLPGFWWTWEWDLSDNFRLYEHFVQNLGIENDSYDKTTQIFSGVLPKVHPCPRRESCFVLGDGINATCQSGYEGWLCTQCSTGYYSWLDNCLECPSWQWFLLEVLVILVVIGVLIVIIVWDLNRNSRGDRSAVDKLLARAKILLGFYQVMGEVFSALDEIKWPGVLREVGSLLRLVEADVVKIIISPRCYFPDFTYPNIYIEFIFGLSFVVFVLCAALCCYGFTTIYLLIKEPSSFEITRTLTKTRQRCNLFVVMLLFVSYPSLSSVIFTLLPPSCDLFYLDENDVFNVTRLRSDYSIVCETQQHVDFTHAAEAALAYVIGFPLLLFILLWWIEKPGEILFVKKFFNVCDCADYSRRSSRTVESGERSLLDFPGQVPNYRSINAINGQSINDSSPPCGAPDDAPLTATGEQGRGMISWKSFLCENYKPQFWYWEIVELARKIVQTLFVLLFGYEDPFTLFATIVISVAFLLIHSSVRPMKDDVEHRLQLFSLGSIFLNLLVASLLLLPTNEDHSSSEIRKEVLAVTLVALNLSIILFVLVSLIWSGAKAFWRHGCCARLAAGVGGLWRQCNRPRVSRSNSEDGKHDELRNYADIPYSDIAKGHI
ncbi:uncharacterized protein LOC119721014 [Patiria miniata]|uniref:Uncharacterized protein n=1 Tax=Patiria miniata TaxID=46514 RepID=A0A913Z7J3_PATMI|nr:uncharacterized protein LOC119721014 [Patiria miniata]XP_038046806.1 uncharacterized protein LOC119721014 [Patiria miniata]